MNDPLHTLDGTLDQVWARLGRGVADARHAFRTPVIATTGTYGPEARVVVLRRADRARAQLEVHTDARSAKVAALDNDPRMAFLFWEPKHQFQVRIRTRVEVIRDDIDRWAKVPEHSRWNYGAEPAPGTPIDTPAASTGHNPADFVALVCHVDWIDTLYLARDVHRHTRFMGPDWTGTWVAP